MVTCSKLIHMLMLDYLGSAHSERLSWVVGVWDFPGQQHGCLHGSSHMEIFCKHC